MENSFFALCPLGFTKPVTAEMPDKTPGATEPVPRSEGQQFHPIFDFWKKKKKKKAALGFYEKKL